MGPLVVIINIVNYCCMHTVNAEETATEET